MFNQMAKENIWDIFKKAMSNNFPKGHFLHPTINQHTVKLSYSTTPNMASKMGAHNNRVEANNQTKGKKGPALAPKQRAKNHMNADMENRALKKA